MRALVLESPGDPPSLAVRERDAPAVGSGDVLVRVAAAGLCGHDVSVMRGTLRRGVRPGVILGHEISGTVVDTGGEVRSVRVGDAVVSTLTTFCGDCERCLSGDDYRCLYARGIGHGVDGGFAELVALPEGSVIPVSNGIDLEWACLLSCPMGVAVRAARDVAGVRAGETVVVTGAGGGLGVHAALATAALGARVLALTTSVGKIAPLEGLGLEVVHSDELPFSELVLALTEDRGADVVLDAVGSAVFEQSLRSLSQGGRLVLMGEVAGSKVEVSPAEIMFRNATIAGATGASRRHAADALDMLKSGDVACVASRRFPFEEAHEAYRLMRNGESFGRLLLIP